MINRSKSSAVKNISRRDTFKYILLLEGIIVGIVCGVAVAFFRYMLIFADSKRNMLVEWINEPELWSADFLSRFGIAALILLAITVGVAMILKWEPECAGSGIPQVEGELRGQLDMNYFKVIIAKIIGCVMSIGGGLALGREGPSVQLGAMAGKMIARGRACLLTEERLLISCGAGAGLSAAFGAPLAGAMFALEELHKNFSALVLVTTMASAAVSDWLASAIVGRQPVFDITLEHVLPLRYYWAVILTGLILGLLGACYNRIIDSMQNLFGRIGSIVPAQLSGAMKLLVMFACALVMMYIYPMALGSGGGLVVEICRGSFTLKALLILLMVKLLYSTASFGSGAPGGIFLPLLVLGAITGGSVGTLLVNTSGMESEYVASFVVIAMAGMFAAIVRAPATGIILITEMTGSFSCLLALVTVSLVAHVVAEFAGAEPIYDQLWNRRCGLGHNEIDEAEANRKSIIEEDVHMASAADGMTVEELGLPAGCLIVAVIRENRELIPSGTTVLHAGDHLEILCRQKDISATEAVIMKKCVYHEE